MGRESSELVVDNLHKSFGGVHALRGLNYTIHSGKTLGIIGGNGAGKTTAIDVVTGRFPPDSGKVLLGGKNITGKPTETLARMGICRTWQSPKLPPTLRVWEYLSLAHDFGFTEHVLSSICFRTLTKQNQRKAQTSVFELLERFEVSELAHRGCGQLSGGEGKFVSLLRAFLKQPSVLFLDEPTTALNHVFVGHVESLIREFVDQGGALAVVSHDNFFLKRVVDGVVMIANGKATELSEIPEAENTASVAPKSEEDKFSSLRPVVEATGLEVSIQNVSLLKDIEISVREGEFKGIIGRNGAGKSTLLKSIHGFTPRGAGRVRLLDKDITHLKPHLLARLGVGFALQGARIPPRLTVASALRMASTSLTRLHGAAKEQQSRVWNSTSLIYELYERVPALAERANVRAGLLSGGEQQLLAIGMQFCRKPLTMFLDEPSIGLHESAVDSVFGWLGELACQGLSGLIVEHNTSALANVVNSFIEIEQGCLRKVAV